MTSSFASVGYVVDDAMTWSFKSTMQIELLERQRRTTRVALANPMFDHIEMPCKRRRRYSSIGNWTSNELEEVLERQLTNA